MDTPRDLDSWHDTVQKMVDRGASGTDEQFDDIMDYLHRTMTTIEVNSADADELQLVLNIPAPVAQRIIEQRSKHKFTDLAQLKAVPGIDAASLNARARLIYFQ
jgi:competence protein ComEA